VCQSEGAKQSQGLGFSWGAEREADSVDLEGSFQKSLGEKYSVSGEKQKKGSSSHQYPKRRQGLH